MTYVLPSPDEHTYWNLTGTSENSKPEIPIIQSCQTGNYFWHFWFVYFGHFWSGPSQSCRRDPPKVVGCAFCPHLSQKKKTGIPKVAGALPKLPDRKTEKSKPEIPIIQSCQTGNYFWLCFCSICFAFFVFFGEVSVSMFIGAGQDIQTYRKKERTTKRK